MESEFWILRKSFANCRIVSVGVMKGREVYPIFRVLEKAGIKRGFGPWNGFGDRPAWPVDWNQVGLELRNVGDVSSEFQFADGELHRKIAVNQFWKCPDWKREVSKSVATFLVREGTWIRMFSAQGFKPYVWTNRSAGNSVQSEIKRVDDTETSGEVQIEE